jgi:two-component system, NtrC family, sensor kinase
MIKKFIIFFLVTAFCQNSHGQNSVVDNFRSQLAMAKEDSSRVLILSELAYYYGGFNVDSAFVFAHRAIDLSQKIHFARGEVRGLATLGMEFDTKGDLPQALELEFRGLSIAEENHLALEKVICLDNIGDIFWDLNDFPRAIAIYQQATHISEAFKNQPDWRSLRMSSEEGLGAVFMFNNQLDSAFSHLQKIFLETLNDPYLHTSAMMFFGDLQFKMGSRETGLDYLRQTIRISQNENNHYALGDACRFISECFRDMNLIDSSIIYAKRGLAEAQSIGYKSPVYYTSRALAELYEPIDVKEALHYRKVFDTVNDYYYGPAKVKELQKALSDEQERQRKMEAAAVAYQYKLRQYGLMSGFCIVLLIAFLLYRNNQQKKKANLLLQHQKDKVESTLTELKSTQLQLIQSAKMASLGEITAGIAHEIQNPLNFVNNFSEINAELIEELKKEAMEGNKREVLAIADNLKVNEERITHHGRRADAIVKSMLQHSRSGSGKKEPVNLNAITEECLKLSYHGFQVNDKLFEVNLETDFDEKIGEISAIQSDLVRVLINIFNNAFYAVKEKKKEQGESFVPAVSVRTREAEEKAEIRVKDNGNGIPAKIVDKIFQPFFTTKPTGEGTGLGLSLSYDMVNAHGGEIRLITKENEGTEFIVEWPLKY